jgi:hypothetical protein
MEHAAAQRRAEIGIRSRLAPARHRSSGLILGKAPPGGDRHRHRLVAAFATTRYIQTPAFGVDAIDLTTFAAVSAVLAATRHSRASCRLVGPWAWIRPSRCVGNSIPITIADLFRTYRCYGQGVSIIGCALDRAPAPPLLLRQQRPEPVSRGGGAHVERAGVGPRPQSNNATVSFFSHRPARGDQCERAGLRGDAADREQILVDVRFRRDVAQSRRGWSVSPSRSGSRRIPLIADSDLLDIRRHPVPLGLCALVCRDHETRPGGTATVPPNPSRMIGAG